MTQKIANPSQKSDEEIIIGCFVGLTILILLFIGVPISIGIFFIAPALVIGAIIAIAIIAVITSFAVVSTLTGLAFTLLVAVIAAIESLGPLGTGTGAGAGTGIGTGTGTGTVTETGTGNEWVNLQADPINSGNLQVCDTAKERSRITNGHSYPLRQPVSMSRSTRK
ncbi:hypothetical protein BGW80DRAFT_1321051 [Lactifluus volemus]|nr:hypothetical protein BGW80DRAFT_1321051 [Lactifluus volemus]